MVIYLLHRLLAKALKEFVNLMGQVRGLELLEHFFSLINPINAHI